MKALIPWCPGDGYIEFVYAYTYPGDTFIDPGNMYSDPGNMYSDLGDGY